MGIALHDSHYYKTHTTICILQVPLLLISSIHHVSCWYLYSVCVCVGGAISQIIHTLLLMLNMHIACMLHLGQPPITTLIFYLLPIKNIQCPLWGWYDCNYYATHPNLNIHIVCDPLILLTSYKLNI